MFIFVLADSSTYLTKLLKPFIQDLITYVDDLRTVGDLGGYLTICFLLKGLDGSHN